MEVLFLNLSRAHQQNIVPVVHQAIKESGINKNQISAVAFTRGPGLLGSLLLEYPLLNHLV